MDDLEARLRDEVTRRMQEFSPSEGAPQRIEARVRQRRRRRHLLTGAAMTVAASVLGVTMLVFRPSSETSGSVNIGDDHVETEETTTTKPDETTTTTGDQPGRTTTSSTTPSSSTTTTATAPPPSADPTLNEFTPLTRRGIGPIEVGMTVAEAEAAAGVTIEVRGSHPLNPSCALALVTGTQVWFELEVPNSLDDEFVIRSVTGQVTEEGVVFGSSSTVLENIYGQPTRTVPHRYSNGQVQIYEAGGYAYAATVYDGQVQFLQSGDPAWLDVPEGCQ